eukprot:gnl/TRDRNA2_/TRDRNA2_181355_c0_seq1.p1 gnl/TRDRNA2_/TRDRNA2_181355_c0~~gnl/TRDRNA2_/TRDRNA2_181355_c0_seq1.p1  ORF type:complete len:119 (-),score=29.73 gnl/TRDRNA2_/TRDRNA2_181355_c0_seq1:94-450(-)
MPLVRSHRQALVLCLLASSFAAAERDVSDDHLDEAGEDTWDSEGAEMDEETLLQMAASLESFAAARRMHGSAAGDTSEGDTESFMQTSSLVEAKTAMPRRKLEFDVEAMADLLQWGQK